MMSHDVDMAQVVKRWSGLGPYYAMFPTDFAFKVVTSFCPESGAVLDPFAGRGTSIFAAAVSGRRGLGVEINPVGWLYGHVKLNPSSQDQVLERLHELKDIANTILDEQIASLPPFFQACYSENVLRFLTAARAGLKWNRFSQDAALMAIILVYLHGKREQSLSNQMRQGKALSPDYSVRWWADRGMIPPDVDPYSFLEKRIRWRYAKGAPSVVGSTIIRGDSIVELQRLQELDQQRSVGQFNLLFTSPPYWNVTNYNYDQWLRLWLLGFESHPIKNRGMWQNKFENKVLYEKLLFSTFQMCAALMDDCATIYVRTDKREFTLNTTLSALRSAFPKKSERIIMRPFLSKTQTHQYGDSTPKPGEVDLIFEP